MAGRAPDSRRGEGDGGDGTATLGIIAPGVRRLTDMAVREDGGVALMRKPEELSANQTERKATNTCDKKRTEDRVRTDDFPDLRSNRSDTPRADPRLGSELRFA